MGTLKITQKIPHSREVNFSFLQAASSVQNLNHTCRSLKVYVSSCIDCVLSEKEYVAFVLLNQQLKSGHIFPLLQTSQQRPISCKSSVWSTQTCTTGPPLPLTTAIHPSLQLLAHLASGPWHSLHFCLEWSLPDIYQSSCFLPHFLKAFSDTVILSLWTSLATHAIPSPLHHF